ncbi:MAG: DUF1320 domain-containing protein [Rhodospirillales bacterium]
MTDYCTQADMEKRFSAEEILELTDRDADGTADDGVLDVAIADAGDTIDSYISKRYDLPLAEIPQRLVKIACDLVRYELHKEDPPERVVAAHKEAMATLRDIAAGKALLDVAGSEPAGAENEILFDGPVRTFTSDALKDF